MSNLEMEVDNLLYRLKEQGIVAQATYCLNRQGEVISFEVKILGFLK